MRIRIPSKKERWKKNKEIKRNSILKWKRKKGLDKGK